MKTIKIFFISIILSTSISSCVKEDENSEDEQIIIPTEIIGKWQFVTETINGVDVPEIVPCDLLNTMDVSSEKLEVLNFFDPINDEGSNCKPDPLKTYNYTLDSNNIFTIMTGDVIFSSHEIVYLSSTIFKFKDTEDGVTSVVTYKRI